LAVKRLKKHLRRFQTACSLPEQQSLPSPPRNRFRFACGIPDGSGRTLRTILEFRRGRIFFCLRIRLVVTGAFVYDGDACRVLPQKAALSLFIDSACSGAVLAEKSSKMIRNKFPGKLSRAPADRSLKKGIIGLNPKDVLIIYPILDLYTPS